MDKNMMDNISEMLGNLSEDDMASLREAAKSMLGSSEEESDINGNNKNNGDGNDGGFSGIDPALLMKISSLMSAMNKEDNRSNLISALKPHLSKGRQKKADDAMQLLKLMELMPMLGDGLGFFK